MVITFFVLILAIMWTRGVIHRCWQQHKVNETLFKKRSEQAKNRAKHNKRNAKRQFSVCICYLFNTLKMEAKCNCNIFTATRPRATHFFQYKCVTRFREHKTYTIIISMKELNTCTALYFFSNVHTSIVVKLPSPQHEEKKKTCYFTDTHIQSQ